MSLRGRSRKKRKEEEKEDAQRGFGGEERV
jgi:hypothetical protein